MLALIVAIVVVLVIAQWALPPKLGYVPLLVAVFHLGNVELISDLTPVRLIIIAGLARAASGGLLRFSLGNRLDQLIGLFSIVALLSSLGHKAYPYVPSPFLERVGLVLNVAGTYLYARAYCSREDFLSQFPKHLALVLIPFAALMAVEQTTGENPYSLLGARSEMAGVRNDRYRAQGSFGHAILAGTIAAAALPFMVGLRKRQRLLGNAGIAAAVIGTVAPASSGPIAAFGAAIVLLFLWKWRHLLRTLKIGLGITLLILHFTMQRPIWFLISRIDLIGGSTGWHRSKLIDTAINNLHEWWLFGTDYTRHWMHSGVSFNPDHTDITNYYLQMGVLGGLPLMLAFVTLIVFALRALERALPHLREWGGDNEFAAWCLWASILSWCISFLSIACFDQSFAMFFMLLGAVPAVSSAAVSEANPPDDASHWPSQPARAIHSAEVNATSKLCDGA